MRMLIKGWGGRLVALLLIAQCYRRTPFRYRNEKKVSRDETNRLTLEEVRSHMHACAKGDAAKGLWA